MPAAKKDQPSKVEPPYEATRRIDKSCKERIAFEYLREMKILGVLWARYCEGREEEPPKKGEPIEEGEIFLEHGLGFDYVEADTFNDQPVSYFRYQISWGGPSDEFRFYTDAQRNLDRIEYWFLDWWDGAHVDIERNTEHWQLMAEIFELFQEYIEDNPEAPQCLEPHTLR